MIRRLACNAWIRLLSPLVAIVLIIAVPAVIR